MGIVDRPIGCLPSHPYPPKLKEIPKVLPQVAGVPVYLPPLQTSQPPRLHQYLYDWLIRSQSQEEAQVNTQAVVDLTQSLGWIVNREKSELKPTQVFLFVGYEYHLDSALVKTHSREMAQTSGFDPKTQVETCLDCKMFDVANWVACLNRENGPGGTPSHEALSVSPQGALEISSVVGQPPSLDRSHCSTLKLVAKMKMCEYLEIRTR